MNLNYNQVPK